jgi:hypothetical protein
MVFEKNLPLPRRHRHGGRSVAAAAPPWTSLVRCCIFFYNMK